MSTIYNYIVSTGIIIPDTSQILGNVQQQYKTVFGADLIVTPDTPQGVLITAQALAETAVVNNNATLANQVNPTLAGGVSLDAIMALTLPSGRAAATPTVVSAVALTGVAGTVISAGAQTKTSDGDIFATLSLVTLDGSGNAIVDFASIVNGAIPCPAHALNTIVTNVLGWETVDNDNAGVLGSTTQSDQAARALRSNTLGFQGVALPVAITSSLYAVSGVESLTFLENYNSSPMGMLIKITNGTTLSGKIFGLTTIGNIVVGTTAMTFIESLQNLPIPNPWPIAKYSTTANVTLSGLSTQGGGDWGGSMTGGDIVLTNNQTAGAENGLWVVAAGAWARQAYNVASSTILGSNDGISMKANSIYNCIDGGSDANIASSLLENKSSGCAWNGNTAVNVVEPASGQVYGVLFDRPTAVPVVIKVTTSNGNSGNIIQAVLDYANGLINNLSGFVVGNDVSPFEISGAIMSLYPSYFISKVEVSLQSSISYSTTTIPIAVNQIATTQQSYITVVIA